MSARNTALIFVWPNSSTKVPNTAGNWAAQWTCNSSYANLGGTLGNCTAVPVFS